MRVITMTSCLLDVFLLIRWLPAYEHVGLVCIIYIRMKADGQSAVARIIEIRQYFPTSKSQQAKEDYVK